MLLSILGITLFFDKKFDGVEWHCCWDLQAQERQPCF